MKKLAYIIGGPMLVVVLYVVWYCIAANYDYAGLSGTYTISQNGEKCTLYLRTDQTFLEELSRGGVEQKSEGRWNRYGLAHVSFSKEFLTLSGEELNASGEAHGQFDRTLGLFPTLTLAPFQTVQRSARSCFVNAMTQPYLPTTPTRVCTSVYHFTGKERDSESGLDYFGARYMASTMGRFMSPDPSRLSIMPDNPQTWNRYTYGLNNPLRFKDDNGKWPTEIHNQRID